MFRLLTICLLTTSILASPAAAQFFDDFDGDALAPHWLIQPDANALQHHVNGGMLHVTGLPFPSHPKSELNRAFIRTTFNPVAGDVFARAVVGWDEGEGRMLTFSIAVNLTLVGELRYSEWGPGSPQIIFSRGDSPVMHSFPAPPAGMHEFALLRQIGAEGATISAFLNGELLVTEPTSNLNPISDAGLHFHVVYPNTGMAPLHVDQVQVIPAPPSLTMMLLAGALAAHRRRHR